MLIDFGKKIVEVSKDENGAIIESTTRIKEGPGFIITRVSNAPETSWRSKILHIRRIRSGSEWNHTTRRVLPPR